jgi:hypothetical protein
MSAFVARDGCGWATVEMIRGGGERGGEDEEEPAEVRQVGEEETAGDFAEDGGSGDADHHC